MTVEDINKKLKELYGHQDGNANFRVAKTAGQYEKRLGTFSDFSGGIYLRTVSEVRETLKYPAFKGYDFWVLEKYFPNTTEVVKDTLFLYEPLFVFYNPDTAEALPLNWEAINAIVHIYLFSEKQVKTPSDIEQEEEKSYELESAKLLEVLQDSCTPMATQLHFGEGIVVPRNYNGISIDNHQPSPVSD